MKITANVSLSLALMLLAGAEARADWQVRTQTGTVRLRREDSPGGAVAVKLAAARNEWESFQIVMRSDEAISGVNVEPGDLKGPGGAVLPAAGSRLYREHQLEIREGTYRNEAFQPGWYPDPLVPFRHPVTQASLPKARFAAAPFDLPASQTHAFLVDLYVPAKTLPGEYLGTYRVTAAGREAVSIPVSLVVWDFELPHTATLKTAFGWPAGALRGYYGQETAAGKKLTPGDWVAIETQCAELLTAHRMNCDPPSGSMTPEPQPDGSYRIPSEQIRAFREFVDRYQVNAFCVPNPSHIVKDPEADRKNLAAWLASWDRAAAELARPEVLFYTYLIDEPNDEEAYGFVRKWGKAIRAAGSVVKVMVVEQPSPQEAAWGDLYGAVDIWCPLFSLFEEEPARKRRAVGETLWTYTALCQGKPTPWWHIDYPLLNYRAPSWIAWRYRMRGLLYWGSMSYWAQAKDPWTEPWTYGREPDRKGLVYNGEGTMVYPARDVGYDGVAPSLRLKALRDSIEDYEYLAILERAGRAAEAEKVVLPLAASWFEWNKDPAAYEKARAELAELILKAN
ncbi:MAG: DUF4091 domain-containing protein [Pirellulales bacterium]